MRHKEHCYTYFFPFSALFMMPEAMAGRGGITFAFILVVVPLTQAILFFSDCMCYCSLQWFCLDPSFCCPTHQCMMCVVGATALMPANPKQSGERLHSLRQAALVAVCGWNIDKQKQDKNKSQCCFCDLINIFFVVLTYQPKPLSNTLCFRSRL